MKVSQATICPTLLTGLIMSLNEILADPGLSNWLKDAIKTAYERDPVDALHDVRRLLKMLGERYTQIVNRDRPYALDPDRAKGLWAKSEVIVGERF
jgi:hypothetical protein